MILNGPHENNAKVVFGFRCEQGCTEDDCRLLLQKTVRKDISDSGTWGKAKFIDYDIKWASNNRSEILKKWDMLNQ